MQLQNFYAQDVNGNIVPGAACTLFVAGTSDLATGLQDANGAPLSNPFAANSIGLASVSAPQGVYDVQIVSGLISSKIRVQFIDVTQVASDAVAATASAAEAASSAGDAQSSLEQVIILTAQFIAPSATVPTTRDNGQPLQQGDRYFNTSNQTEYVYKSTGWAANLDAATLALPTGATNIGATLPDGTSGNSQGAIDYLGSYVKRHGVIARVSASNTAEQNAAAIQAAFLQLSKICIPFLGTFVSQPVFPPANWEISGIGSGTILKLPNNPSRMLPDGTLSKQIGLVHIDSGSATTFVDCGEISNIQLMGDSVASGFQEQTHLISLGGARGVNIENVWITAPQGDGVYLGYGSGDSTERHNFDININSCTFNGVNNENRQALSVVDGVNVWMVNCYVVDFTKSTMPGAVDIEPVDGANTTQNIYILNNVFERVGGTSGVTGYIANHQGVVNRFDRPSNNINIKGNTYIDCTNRGGSFACQVATLTASSVSPPLDFTFSENHSLRGYRTCTVVGSGGVRHLNNTYYDVDYGNFFGLQTDGGNYDLRTEGNTYYRVGKANQATAGYAMQVSTNIELKIKDEDFADCGRADGTLGYAIYFVDGTSSGVTISNNKIRSSTGKTTLAIRALSTHTFSSETNSMTDNVITVPGNEFRYKIQNYGAFTFSTTPANLPVGHFFIAVTDAAFPGGRGTIESVKFMDPTDGSYAANTWQKLVPTSANTANTKTFQIRKVDPSTGLWQTPVVYTGV